MADASQYLTRPGSGALFDERVDDARAIGRRAHGRARQVSGGKLPVAGTDRSCAHQSLQATTRVVGRVNGFDTCDGYAAVG